jgi:hypothetical protein
MCRSLARIRVVAKRATGDHDVDVVVEVEDDREYLVAIEPLGERLNHAAPCTDDRAAALGVFGIEIRSRGSIAWLFELRVRFGDTAGLVWPEGTHFGATPPHESADHRPNLPLRVLRRSRHRPRLGPWGVRRVRGMRRMFWMSRLAAIAIVCLWHWISPSRRPPRELHRTINGRLAFLLSREGLRDLRLDAVRAAGLLGGSGWRP